MAVERRAGNGHAWQMTGAQAEAPVERRSLPDAPLAISEPASLDWDRFVLGHPQGHLLQLSAWGRLKAAFGWSCQRVAVVGASPAPVQPATEAHAAPVALYAGAQLLFRSRYGVSVGYVPRGPLFSGDAAVDRVLLSALAHVARRRRAVFLRLEPNLLDQLPLADRYHTWLMLQGFQPAMPLQPRSTIHLDLAPPVDQLMAGFSKGHRADIRRAERRGVTVRVGTADDVGLFHAIMQATGTRASFGVHAEAYYRLAYQLFGARCRLLLAEQEGQAVAGHMVFADAQNGLYLYSGANESGLKSGANHLLQWYAIQWAREQGCAGYDLWGIPDALGQAAVTSDPDERAALEAQAAQDALVGVYRFKKGFGGSVVRYLPAYDQVYLPPLYALWRRRFAS